MTWAAWLTICVVVAMVGTLILTNLAADAVFQWCYNGTSVGIVFRIGSKDK